ncbi:MAG TPA: hypothetical protein VMO20_09125 [Candidatus Acidoferrum sp.]|nr:hypothetical protein [Candidatus Acidoferrum sp.]
MKTKFAAAVLWFAALGFPISSVFAQGTLFTYQGQLTTASGPAQGTYNMTFQLWNASSGGTQAGSTITTNGVVIVTNGLFTVYLDFGNQYSTGTSYWLQLGVETNGGGSFATLTPRQELTPTPYAIFAEGANASGLSGTIPMASFAGTYGDPVDLSNPGNIFTGNGAGLTGVNASLLGGLTSSNFWQTTGNVGTIAGSNFVGTIDDQPLYLDSFGNPGLQLQFVARSLYPIIGNQQAMNTVGGYWGNTISNNVIGGTIAGGGGQEFILQLGGGGESYYPNIVTGDYGAVGGGYANTAGFGAAIPGGYENVATGNASFAAGSYAQALHNGSFVWADSSGGTFSDTGPNQFQIRASGGVGIGTVNGPQQYLSVRGGMNIDQANDNAGFINNGNTNGYGLTFGSGSGEGIASKRTSGGNQYGLDFYTGFADRMSIDNSGDLTINGGQLFLTSGSTTSAGYGLGYWTGLPGNIPGGAGPFLYGYEGGALGAVGPETVCLSWDYSGDVWVSNNCSVASLTIRGGADLAEPFNITSRNGDIPRGAVVVIDEQNPGHLKLSDTPYDTRVAGIISGANGVNPGIQMHQQGIIEGGQNVALSGRVYVQADASNGPIRPGDMLTTSSTPGYAMKVTDHVRAEGAILGKAMTGLSHGSGMVLVLVTLQ